MSTIKRECKLCKGCCPNNNRIIKETGTCGFCFEKTRLTITNKK